MYLITKSGIFIQHFCTIWTA